MPTNVTLTLLDTLYAQALDAARASSQPVETLLTKVLLHTFGYTEGETKPEPRPDEETWQALRPLLLAAYLGEIVALRGGEIVDHDADEGAILARMEVRYPGEALFLRRVRRAERAVRYEVAPRRGRRRTMH